MKNFYVWLEDQQQGPFTLDQLREKWKAGSVNSNTLYAQDGMANWLPLKNIEGDLTAPPRRTFWTLPSPPGCLKPEPDPVHEVSLPQSLAS